MSKFLVNKMSGVCWKCTENQQHKSFSDNPPDPCIRAYDLVRAVYTGKGTRVIDCWECRECHNLVPVDSWHTYIQTGDVVIRQERRRK